MKKKAISIFAISMIFMGIFLMSGFAFRTTGYVISDKIGYDSLAGFVFILLGIILFVLSLGGLEDKIKLTSNQEKALSKLVKEKQSGKVGTYKEIHKVIEKLGYTIKGGGKHKGVFTPEGKKITIIPHGKKANKYTYKGILEDIINDVEFRYKKS